MLDQNAFFIREHVGMLKLANTYDILDPETQEPLGIAKEKPGGFIHFMRLLLDKKLLPTKIFVYEGSDPEDEDQLLFSINKGGMFFRTRVNICDPEGNVLGWLKSKMFSLGGAFRVFNSQDEEVAQVKGDWKGWNFRLLDPSGEEMGTVTKKWSGIGKELFTSADNYIISLHEQPSEGKAVLLLAAGLAIDTVYKE